MKIFLRVFFASVAFMTTAHAMPPVPHLAHSTTVRAVDYEKRIVTLVAQGKDEPVAFVVENGRTKLTCDKRPAELKTLKAGQKVRLYYKREHGENVATEMAWTSAPSSGQPEAE